MTDFFTIERIENYIVSAVIVGVGWLLWRIIRRLLEKSIQTRREKGGLDTRESRSAAELVFNVIKTVLIVLIVLAVLQVNGININSLVAGLGIFSAVVGLALQDLLKDVIMGTHIMSDDFFKVGDVVRYNGEEGVVISFNLRTTKIRSISDNAVLTVCNRNISEISQCSDVFFLSVPVSYATPSEKAGKALDEIRDRIRALEGCLECENLGLTAFEDSDIAYTLQIRCSPAKKPYFRRLANQIIWEIFQREDISVPYPQVDVHYSGEADRRAV